MVETERPQMMPHGLGCNMSLKIYFFPPNVGEVSDDDGERLRQDISTMEKRYAVKSSQNMLADCCWNLTEKVSIAS